MRLRQLLIRHATTLRMMLAAWALALALNGVGYVAHHHTVDPGSTPAAHVELCGYCTAFGGMADAPTQLLSHQLPAILLAVLVLFAVIRLPRRVLTAAQARAPPTR